jgi:hypothetical protein
MLGPAIYQHEDAPAIRLILGDRNSCPHQSRCQPPGHCFAGISRQGDQGSGEASGDPSPRLPIGQIAPIGADGRVMVVQHPPRIIPLQAERGWGPVTPEAIDQDGAGSRRRALVVDEVLAGGVEGRMGGVPWRAAVVSRRVRPRGTSCRKMSLTPLSSPATRSGASLWNTTSSPLASAAG